MTHATFDEALKPLVAFVVQRVGTTRTTTLYEIARACGLSSMSIDDTALLRGVLHHAEKRGLVEVNSGGWVRVK